FHRAAIQSGPARYALSAEQGTDQMKRFLRELSIAEDASAIAALRALPAQALVAAQGGGGGSPGEGRRGFSPVLDGAVLPVHPADALQRGLAPDVPLIIGTNFDEASLFLGAEPALTDPSR